MLYMYSFSISTWTKWENVALATAGIISEMYNCLIVLVNYNNTENSKCEISSA